jgi:hypothetical protein
MGIALYRFVKCFGFYTHPTPSGKLLTNLPQEQLDQLLESMAYNNLIEENLVEINERKDVITYQFMTMFDKTTYQRINREEPLPAEDVLMYHVRLLYNKETRSLVCEGCCRNCEEYCRDYKKPCYWLVLESNNY